MPTKHPRRDSERDSGGIVFREDGSIDFTKTSWRDVPGLAIASYNFRRNEEQERRARLLRDQRRKQEYEPWQQSLLIIAGKVSEDAAREDLAVQRRVDAKKYRARVAARVKRAGRSPRIPPAPAGAPRTSDTLLFRAAVSARKEQKARGKKVTYQVLADFLVETVAPRLPKEIRERVLLPAGVSKTKRKYQIAQILRRTASRS
jgi:hypothetical protein